MDKKSGVSQGNANHSRAENLVFILLILIKRKSSMPFPSKNMEKRYLKDNNLPLCKVIRPHF